jgi:Tol biopolymer transport system component
MTLRLSAVLAATATAWALATPATLATSIPLRTYVGSVAPDGAPANGASEQPVLSASGRVLAFDTTATNLAEADGNGALRDVVALDLATNERRLVSQPPGSAGADGPSFEPSISSDGQRIAFTSLATNIVPGDANGQADVFVRTGRDPLQLVSVGLGGAPANGTSSVPDISADGKRVAFQSTASNLVPDDTNGKPDVFVRDLATGRTTRVSVANDESQAAGWSGSPAISADGNYVAFTSGAANLVRRDTNGVTDVFVRDIRRGVTERISVNSKGRQQNRSVQPPFFQIPDISDDGRYVVFDSDATNLYTPDTNKHTDVFLRDRKKRTTTLVSASSTNVQGNNDSFAPRITPGGRYLSFQSFANNLAPGDGPREDIFVRDLRQGTTNVVNVTATGDARGSEQVKQLLQRPAISDDGQFAAFSSTVTNLVADDTNGTQDVFVRLMDAPVGRVVAKPKPDRKGIIRIQTDDPKAFAMVCQIDNGPPGLCGREIPITGKIGRVLKIRAGGPGMLYSDDVMKVRLSNDRTRPKVRISRPRGRSIRVIRGRATDRSGNALVQLGFVYGNRRGCKYLVSPKAFSKGISRTACVRAVPVNAKGGRFWHLRLPRAVHGNYAIYATAYDKVGNASKLASLSGIIG